MIRRIAFGVALFCAAMASADTVSQQATEAARDLQVAVADLDAAVSAKDRVAALTQTIKAYESGLLALREALRQAELRQSALELEFQAKRDQVGQLIGVLSSLDADPGPLLLLHPTGPLGTVRSGMLLADVAPALQADEVSQRLALQRIDGDGSRVASDIERRVASVGAGTAKARPWSDVRRDLERRQGS